MNNLAVKDHLSRIIQDPKIIQHIQQETNKAVQLNVVIQVNGDSAIDRVCADDGNIYAAMRHLLSVLPEPRWKNLKTLAMATAVLEKGHKAVACEYLGISRTILWENRGGWNREIERLKREGFANKGSSELSGEV